MSGCASSSGTTVASEVGYENTQSGLTATDVQAALAEVVTRLNVLQIKWKNLQADYTTLQQNYESLHQAVTGISWNNLADIPAGFADGVDDEGSGVIE
ncbi:MAG: hypothetical protein JRJ19_10875 [Deltaproteobacteria bacterium]|nr:hypothetical protein [Deltaproteobacteria bacterium]